MKKPTIKQLRITVMQAAKHLSEVLDADQWQEAAINVLNAANQLKERERASKNTSK